MKEPKFTRYKVTILKGAIGDMGREWMTDKDWEEHDKYVEELKASGEYLQPEEVIIDMIDSPFHDDRSYTPASLESASMTFLDFGKTDYVITRKFVTPEEADEIYGHIIPKEQIHGTI